MLEFIFVQFKCGVSNKGIDPALLKVLMAGLLNRREL